MGDNRFWIGGYTSSEYMQGSPWLVAPTDDGAPYLCCKCPCVEAYTIFAFRTISLSGDNHDIRDWCSQSVSVSPMGVQAGTHHICLDNVVLYGLSGVMVAVDMSAGLYEECGRTVVSTETYTESWYEIRIYRIAPAYTCYDEFWQDCFGHCNNLPCDEWDEQTYECTHHRIPDGTYVFDGTHRPWYGYLSNAMSNYGCTQYWYNLAYDRYVPKVDISLATMQMMCTLERDAWDCLQWSTTETCDRMGLYGASLDINGNKTYHTLIWNGEGDMPERTTSANVGWLGSAISSILPLVSEARQTKPSTWRLYGQPYTYNGVLCEDMQVTSQQFCNYDSNYQPSGMKWYWQCVRAVITKPDDAPTDAIGVKVKVTQTLRDYDGSWDGPSQAYTETYTTSELDVTWGTTNYFKVADGLIINASATACYPESTHSNACITPCMVDGHPFPWQEITVKIEAMEYIFASGG